MFGAQAGSRYELARGVRIHLLVEDNVGTFYAASTAGWRSSRWTLRYER